MLRYTLHVFLVREKEDSFTQIMLNWHAFKVFYLRLTVIFFA